VVRGAWFAVRGSLSLTINAWLAIGLVYGSRIVEHCPRATNCFTWNTGHGSRITDHCPRLSVLISR